MWLGFIVVWYGARLGQLPSITTALFSVDQVSASTGFIFGPVKAKPVTIQRWKLLIF